MITKLKEFFGFEEDTESIPSSASIMQKPPLEATKPQVIGGYKTSPTRPQTAFNAGSMAASEIKVEEPKIYEDSLNIAAYLRETKPVIVNLKHLDADTGKRLIDFVCGTAYAINGHMLKIADNIFLFTPQQMLIVDSEERSQFEQGLHQEESSLFLNGTA